VSERVTVRRAQPEDWPAVAALLAELGRPAVLGTPEEAPTRELFVAYLEREDTEALVGELDGGVVGFVDMEYQAWLNFTKPQAWIPNLIVSEASRSRGVGAALLARAEELARVRGCFAMRLESASWRTRAHGFYLREGWTDSGKSFVRLLDDAAWPPAPPR
jgi:GNAT superfamily N-acetyltransferase